MKCKTFLMFVFAVFVLSFVSASYVFGDFSVQENYQAGSSISGALNISFTNEFVNNYFTDSFGNAVSLKDLLLNSMAYVYDCEYAGCESEFALGEFGNDFVFDLNKGESTFYGLRFNEKLTNINSVEFTFDSDAGEFNESQLAIDFFDDGIVDVESFDVGSTLRDANFGCFESSDSYTEIALSSVPYCQEVQILRAPGLKVGAWVKEVTYVAGSNVSMKIYDGNGDFFNGCNLPINSINSTGKRVFCDVNDVISEDGVYYVCLSATGDGQYKTRGHAQSQNCGFQNFPLTGREKVYTYEMGVAEKYFGSVKETTISNALGNGKNLAEIVENYIEAEYGSLDCSSDGGCRVPIRILSAVDQKIELKNFAVSYAFLGGESGATATGFYKFNEVPSRVNASRQNLPLGSFFKIPNEEGDFSYQLNYKGNKLFEKEISIKDYDLKVFPKNVSYDFPFEFLASYPPSLNVSSFYWDFGDGNFATTADASVFHTYNSSGNFVLVLQISTNLGEISDSFSIAVGSPKDLLTSELSEKESLLKEVENSLYSLNAFERAQVTKVVDLDALKANLSQFKDEAQGAVSDEDYHHIISNFLSLDFPVSVEKVPVKKLFFVSNSNDFDLDALSEVTGLDYNSTTATYDYIEFWEINNLDVDYSLDKILINWEDGSDSTVNLFDFSIDFKGKTKEDYYFFVKDGVDFDFGDVENVKEIEGYKYFVSPTGTLVFATSELVNLKDYFFIAPKKVELQNGFEVEEARVNYWVFVFGFVFVVLVGFGIYFFVHWWYDKKYEGFLFPDKNQLYNAMVYITNSVSEGASEDEIRKNLLGVGWKREQVSYLLKKYAGRRTGIVNLFGFGKKTGYSGNTPPKPGRNADFSGDYPKFNK